MVLLGVNIDHVATIRQARRTRYPQPLEAAILAEAAGADGITIHLREDRRHINEADVFTLRQQIKTRLNLEMALTPEMLEIACQVKPEYVCLVPEKREELTTEGGLDLLGSAQTIERVAAANEKLTAAGIKVSLFINATRAQLEAAARSGCPLVELHTGAYADAPTKPEQAAKLQELVTAAELAHDLGLQVNAGHGLNYDNVRPIVSLPHLYELNIGHAIVARSLMVGMKQAVQEMKKLLV